MATPNALEGSTDVAKSTATFAAGACSLELPDLDQDASIIDFGLDFHGIPHCIDASISEAIWQGVPIQGDGRHALKALGRHEEDDTFNFPHSSGFTPTPAQRPKRSRVPTWKKIKALRDEVAELTARLRTLEADQQRNAQQTPRDLNPLKRSELWKQIAERQLEHRQISEEENMMLRELMHVQIQEARSLRWVLKRRDKIKLLGTVLGVEDYLEPPKTAPLPDVTQSGTQAFEKIMLDVDHLYVRAESIFMEKGIQKIPYPGRKRRAVATALNGVRYELIDRRAIPFSSKAIEEAMWDALTQLVLTELQCVKITDTDVQFQTEYSDQTTATSLTSLFVTYYGTGNFVMSVKVQKIVRKYVEDSRSVFIYRLYVEPKTASDQVGVRIVVTLVLEVQYHGAIFAGDTALLQGYFYVTRYDEGLPAGQLLRLSANLDLGLVVWEELVFRIYRHMENNLPGETCAENVSV
ncbi:hypothetical protein PPTG_08994 [Phytophthora nicotianae INRA-310]|uniref:Uncharacterized protein n=1 Tax=Phytophthora nicotianae (strain INRA-310) TaxID=761204 RepID=W2QL74_PHYN3|nr:hypothetical protein PPTG_08994 [Phytophthora nicotianae INRA-310]ETN13010.1 hypothetical protein PPTG_08994 [Phytophthora nicotianae INRA-310]